MVLGRFLSFDPVSAEQATWRAPYGYKRVQPTWAEQKRNRGKGPGLRTGSEVGGRTGAVRKKTGPEMVPS